MLYLILYSSTCTQLTGFPMKSEIIEQLRQPMTLLPSLIAEGLAANDQGKVRLGVVQTAS